MDFKLSRDYQIANNLQCTNKEPVVKLWQIALYDFILFPSLRRIIVRKNFFLFRKNFFLMKKKNGLISMTIWMPFFIGEWLEGDSFRRWGLRFRFNHSDDQRYSYSRRRDSPFLDSPKSREDEEVGRRNLSTGREVHAATAWTRRRQSALLRPHLQLEMAETLCEMRDAF